MHLMPCQQVHLNPQTFLNGSKRFCHDAKCFRIEFARPQVRIRVWSTNIHRTCSFRPDPESSRKQMSCCLSQLFVCRVWSFDRQNLDTFYWKHNISIDANSPGFDGEEVSSPFSWGGEVGCSSIPGCLQILDLQRLASLYQTESPTSRFGVRVGCSR